MEYKLDVVRQCSEPGVSVAALAMARGINANLVRRWIVRHRRARMDSTPKPCATLLPVTIEAATARLETRADNPADVTTKRRRPEAASIEIELYGARIHLRGGVDAQALKSVLDVLAQR